MRRSTAAKRIIALRTKLGLTQEQFAHHLGCVVSSVNKWECGHAKPSRLAQRRLKELEQAGLVAPEVAS